MLKSLNVKMNKGFTLLEVIVAIFIITVSVGSALALVSQTIAFTQITSSRFVAVYLAQEGIEIVRNTRDSNWLAGNAWDLNLPSGTTTGLLGKFTRTININDPGTLPVRRVVSVVVSWQDRGRSHQVTAQTELYNWR